jgi:hypothetical protein
MVEKYYIEFNNTSYGDWIELTKELLKDMNANSFLSMDIDDANILFHYEFDDYKYDNRTIIETIIAVLDSVVDQDKYSMVFRFEEKEVGNPEYKDYIDVKMPLYLVIEMHLNKRVATLHNVVINNIED